jgi:hypothetical protein
VWVEVESPSDAEAHALAWIEAGWHHTCKAAITGVEDLGDSWRVSYNTAEYVETGDIVHALAGNHPLLIQKDTGEVSSDMSSLVPELADGLRQPE